MKHGKMTVILETALPKLIAGGKNGAKGISLIELYWIWLWLHAGGPPHNRLLAGFHHPSCLWSPETLEILLKTRPSGGPNFFERGSKAWKCKVQTQSGWLSRTLKSVFWMRWEKSACLLASAISLLSFENFVFIKWLFPTHASQKYAIWAQNSPNLPRVVRS